MPAPQPLKESIIQAVLKCEYDQEDSQQAVVDITRGNVKELENLILPHSAYLKDFRKTFKSFPKASLKNFENTPELTLKQKQAVETYVNRLRSDILETLLQDGDLLPKIKKYFKPFLDRYSNSTSKNYSLLKLLDFLVSQLITNCFIAGIAG
jgi:hypothetical protein